MKFKVGQLVKIVDINKSFCIEAREDCGKMAIYLGEGRIQIIGGRDWYTPEGTIFPYVKVGEQLLLWKE